MLYKYTVYFSSPIFARQAFDALITGFLPLGAVRLEQDLKETGQAIGGSEI
jgi:hypothetical protein